MPNLTVKVLTLFPEAFPGLLDLSVIGRAKEKLWKLEIINIRDYSFDNRQTVDEKTAGGGHGMIIKPDVLSSAITNNQYNVTKKYLLSPRGKLFTQKKANEILLEKNVMLICGRYEGVDQRVIDYHDLEEISIGDYVLSGGEIAAQVIIDACVRLIPGVLLGESPHEEESLSEGKYEYLLEYPHYTKPNIWKGIAIPEVLLSGNHKKIAEWRLEQAKSMTRERRSDLWNKYLRKKNDS